MTSLATCNIPFPQAASGQKRFVICPPPREEDQESKHLRLQIIVGRYDAVDDPDTYRYMGTMEEETVSGFGVPYYVVNSFGKLAHKGGAPEAPLDAATNRFVQMLDMKMIRYNSKVPVVVYVPEDGEVRYKIWKDELGRLRDGDVLTPATPANPPALAFRSLAPVNSYPQEDQRSAISANEDSNAQRRGSKPKKKKEKNREVSEANVYPTEGASNTHAAEPEPVPRRRLSSVEDSAPRDGDMRRRISSSNGTTSTSHARSTGLSAVEDKSERVGNGGLTAVQDTANYPTAQKEGGVPHRLSAVEGDDGSSAAALARSNGSTHHSNNNNKPRRLSSIESRGSDGIHVIRSGPFGTEADAPNRYEAKSPVKRQKSRTRTGSIAASEHSGGSRRQSLGEDYDRKHEEKARGVLQRLRGSSKDEEDGGAREEAEVTPQSATKEQKHPKSTEVDPS